MERRPPAPRTVDQTPRMPDQQLQDILKRQKLKSEGEAKGLVVQPLVAMHAPRTMQTQHQQLLSSVNMNTPGWRQPARQNVGSPRCLMIPQPDSDRSAAAELQVRQLTFRNLELTREVEKYKTLRQDEGKAFSQERETLEEAQQLLWDLTYRMEEEKGRQFQEAAEAKRLCMEAQEKLERVRHQNLQGGAAVEQEGSQAPRPDEEHDHLRAALLRAEAERDSWRERARRAEGATPGGTSPPAGGGCSESRLRAVMTSHSSTTAELRQAIEATQALLVEANRELSAKQLREKRAAFEGLYQAMDKDDEDALEAALAAARSAEVESEDVEKAQAKLEALRSMTDEERQAKVRRALEVRRKKEAFALIKRDDAPALRALLDALPEEVPGARWEDWRDYAGRSILKCARELRSSHVQCHLQERLGLAPDERHGLLQRQLSPRLGTPKQAHAMPLDQCLNPLDLQRPRLKSSSSVDRDSATGGGIPGARLSRQVTPQGLPGGDVDADAERAGGAAPAGEPSQEAQPSDAVAASPRGWTVQAASGTGGAAGADEELPEVTPEEEDIFRPQAFRAVVQDDCDTLKHVLGHVPSSQWRKWENKAGKDLLMLSQERSSTDAYAVLAKALGMVTEMKREAFEERETVWVFVQGEVQPRHATVLEDTPKEADEVLVEYWEGDSPPELVDKCMVRKTGS